MLDRSIIAQGMLACLIAASGVSCGSSPIVTSADPPALGRRVRITVEGRDIPSILTEDTFVYLTVLRPDGPPIAAEILGVATGSTDGLSLAMASYINATAEHSPRPPESTAEVAYEETLDLGDVDLTCAEDVILPAGWRISDAPGDLYILRMVDGKMVSDELVELSLSTILADGSGYFRHKTSSTEPLARAEDPPGWPASAR